MKSTADDARISSAAIAAALVVAGVFEAVTVPETQDKRLWAATPWKADPYHAVVSLTQFAVPALVLLIALRLLARHAPGGPDRSHQTVRAAGAMTALVWFTLAVEWAAVAVGANSASPGTWSTVTVALAVLSVLALAAAALLVRSRRQRGASGRWRQDGLGDVVHLCLRIPVLRRWVTPQVADRARRRAMTVFLVLSVLAAAALTGAQAVGEHMTDPVLVGWWLVAMTSAGLTFCLIGNAVTGFVARPARSRPRRVAEASALAGCLGMLAATAFHDPLWSVLAEGPLTPRSLAVLTLGAGVAAALLAAALGALLLRRRKAAQSV